jgi:hypothetical protein
MRTLHTLDKGLRDPVARDAATQPETVPAGDVDVVPSPK